MSTMQKNQRKASLKYYHENKEEVNETRKEYFKAYAKQKYEEIRNDDEKRQQRNEYYKQLRQRKKVAKINSKIYSLELEILSCFAV